MTLFAIQHRRALIVAFHACLVAGTSYFAYMVLSDGMVPLRYMQMYWHLLPWLILIRLLTFAPFHLYQGMWRYTGMADLAAIVCATTISTIVAFLIAGCLLGIACPTPVYVVDTLMLILLMGGLRAVRAVYYGIGEAGRRKRVVVYGAGDVGAMVIREMKNSRRSEYQPVGLIDDNVAMKGRWIHGVKVLGGSAELERLVAEKKPHILLLALPGLAPARAREIVKRLERFQISLKTLPPFNDLVDSNVHLDRIRSVALGDLLIRKPLELDSQPLERLIIGKRVLVTGAGGSIGSELSRQLAGLKPDLLMLFDRHENGLFDIENDLIAKGHGDQLIAMIGDIADRRRIDQVFREFAPQIVFHAAAHKHVPLMERDICEAIKNNVRGTRLLAEAARRYHSDLMILVSTDKAVNPASVMGATKRVGETLIQALCEGSGTSFATVRFGNVLGSNGSVVPHFMKQIAEGGPVTITHPEMRRFFMLIPEAVQLILHAAAIAESGAVYILEMGDQIKVVDLARNLITLAGFTPDKDIPIEFIGLRPGEKLYEELIGPSETAGPSSVPGVLRVTAGVKLKAIEVRRKIAAMETAALRNQSEEAARLLADLITNYHEPQNWERQNPSFYPDGRLLANQPKFGRQGKRKSLVPGRERATVPDRVLGN